MELWLDFFIFLVVFLVEVFIYGEECVSFIGVVDVLLCFGYFLVLFCLKNMIFCCEFYGMMVCVLDFVVIIVEFGFVVGFLNFFRCLVEVLNFFNVFFWISVFDLKFIGFDGLELKFFR